MSLSLDAAAFVDLLTDPGRAESMSAVGGAPLVVVDASGAADAQALAGADITTVPAVVIMVARDPGALPPGAFGAADVILSEDPDADAPFVAPADGIAAAIERIESALRSNPVAGASLAMLLRCSARLTVPEALIAESATYSALQEGAEFHRWRAGHPARQPAAQAGTPAGTERVLVQRDGSELRITLARPERRNAVDRQMRDELAAALAVAVADRDCQVVLCGLGPDFCAGGDLDEFGSRPDPATAHVTRLTRSPARLLHLVAPRTTAYLHGSCLGAGIELPAFAARVIAAESTRLGLPEIRLGLVPGAGGTASLPRRIGRWRTAYLALTGHVADAREALRWGLVDAIVPDPVDPT